MRGYPLQFAYVYAYIIELCLHSVYILYVMFCDGNYSQ